MRVFGILLILGGLGSLIATKSEKIHLLMRTPDALLVVLVIILFTAAVLAFVVDHWRQK